MFDVALALPMLLLSSPAWLAIAAAIKLDDGGPVFYRQERWGRGQSRFQVLKFRTMVEHSDREFGVRQATSGDRRITRVGRLLRATGLDELPQVLNILIGDMSFVGPRALSTTERAADGTPIRYDETRGFAHRLQVRPGLTGLATIYLPKDAPSPLKFRVDQLYVNRLSFWLDLRLVALSFWISFRGKWETRTRKV
jgi:lipopolysaccharide/colanic/teichoic acid biosynthesis glycosyltransferase